MWRLLLTPVVLLLVLAGCSQSGDPGAPGAKAADILITNARVYTANSEQPWAQALAIRGSEIVYVGDHAGAAAYVGRGCEQLDLRGGLVLPLNRGEGLTLEQAIENYERAAEQQLGWDGILGSFEPGKRADLVVLDRHLLNLDAAELRSARPLLTMVDGRVVSELRWRRESGNPE
jgi:predicted amidohydrolase YtcJ